MIFKLIQKPIINKTKQKIVSKSYILCENFLSKIIGTMFRRNIKYPYVFIFSKPSNESFHTFFCFKPLDIFFLDRNKKVVEIFKKVSPFKIICPKSKYKYVIEVPSDFNVDIDVNDEIEF